MIDLYHLSNRLCCKTRVGARGRSSEMESERGIDRLNCEQLELGFKIGREDKERLSLFAKKWYVRGERESESVGGEVREWELRK